VRRVDHAVGVNPVYRFVSQHMVYGAKVEYPICNRYAARFGRSVALMTAIWDERMLERVRKRLGKRAKKGFCGYPIATIALCGPDDTRAAKLTVGIVPAENATSRTFDVGSPRVSMSATMPLLRKKSWPLSRRSDPGQWS
jgi:hypothetical protein